MNIFKPTEQDTVLMNQLLGGIDAREITEETIGEFQYKHLLALLRFAIMLDGGREFYVEIKGYLEAISIQKMNKKAKLRIGFIVSGIPVWCGDELYHLLDESDLFEPYIYVFLHDMGQGTRMMLKEYNDYITYFQNKGMRVVETIDIQKGRIYSWKEIGEFPDVCIWTTPWIYAHFSQQRLTEYPLSTIHTYIPYSYMLAGNEGNNYVQYQYNYEFHNLMWKIFEENAIAVEMASRYAFVGDSNAVYAGALKMDMFYETVEMDPWKDVIDKCGNTEAKRIIYAPHHSMEPEGHLHFATFQDNYREILELAKKCGDDTVWLFKPHPALKIKAIQVGIFKDESEWNDYVQEWRNLKNGMVYEGTEYHSFFQYSDAMVLDCGSFVAEYLYVNKPQLFLRRKEQGFNEFGKLLLPLLYQVDGKDIKGIEQFIRDIVIDKKDNKREEREEFYKKYLYYRNLTGKEQSAACNVYDFLVGSFNGSRV